jgi:hypothetical protein
MSRTFADVRVHIDRYNKYFILILYTVTPKKLDLKRQLPVGLHDV